MEMEMRAQEDIEAGEDITPPLLPLTSSLHDSFLDTHCSTCFSPLPSPSLITNPINRFSYCSPPCSSLPSLAEELRLLHSHPSATTTTADLRAALRLLSLPQLHSPPSTPPPPRLFGLLTNRDKLLSCADSNVAAEIREGAREMARARGISSSDDDVVVWEEAALCLVMTNAVEVQDKTGRILGLAVYGQDFSWINHSCSPNACYRFSISSRTNTVTSRGETELRIAPLVSTGVVEAQGESGVYVNCRLKQGTEGYGPRILVRSIKPIKKGEEVTVAYTDLLQPKTMRQSELWSKYQFICCCRRCTASPRTYVDCILQEISVYNLEFSSFSSDNNFCLDEANKKLTDFIDEAISEYLSVGDPESCCKKLEDMLTEGLKGDLSECEEGKLQLVSRLHPLHHLALNAYTTLASAYKILSVDSTSEIEGCHWGAFDASKRSAAYSLLLAGATNHLFQSESSLVASAANFWASAGESLLTCASSSGWNSFVRPAWPVSVSLLKKHTCSNCSLMDRFQENSFPSQARNADFQKISCEFLGCVTNMSKKVWSFLIHGCQYLQIFKDPVNFSWFGKSSNPRNFEAHLGSIDEDSCCETEESISKKVAQFSNSEVRMNICLLGVHCLFYGAYLANMCYGEYSPLTCHIKNVFYNEEKLVS